MFYAKNIIINSIGSIMHNKELFAFGANEKEIQALSNITELLEFKNLTHDTNLKRWNVSNKNVKILIHFVDDLSCYLQSIDSNVLTSGTHIAVCTSVSLESEMILLLYGFSGVVDKKHSKFDLVNAINRVLDGELNFTRKSLSRYIKNNQNFTQSYRETNLIFSLTKKETLVLSFACHGLSNSEIATQENVSINTVKMHIQNIYKKTGIHTRTRLISVYSDMYKRTSIVDCTHPKGCV